MSNTKKHLDIRELGKLNIENLFTSNDGNKPYTNGKLDINTLFKKTATNDEDFVFDSELLLEGILIKKQKVRECYASMYKACCDSIVQANKSGITDIVHSIPFTVPNIMDYIPLNCLKFIKEKLDEQNISSRILTQNSIFVTWYNIEEKINMKKDNERNNLSSEENVSKYNYKNSY